MHKLETDQHHAYVKHPCHTTKGSLSVRQDAVLQSDKRMQGSIKTPSGQTTCNPVFTYQYHCREEQCLQEIC